MTVNKRILTVIFLISGIISAQERNKKLWGLTHSVLKNSHNTSSAQNFGTKSAREYGITVVRPKAALFGLRIQKQTMAHKVDSLELLSQASELTRNPYVKVYGEANPKKIDEYLLDEAHTQVFKRFTNAPENFLDLSESGYGPPVEEAEATVVHQGMIADAEETFMSGNENAYGSFPSVQVESDKLTTAQKLESEPFYDTNHNQKSTSSNEHEIAKESSEFATIALSELSTSTNRTFTATKAKKTSSEWNQQERPEQSEIFAESSERPLEKSTENIRHVSITDFHNTNITHSKSGQNTRKTLNEENKETTESNELLERGGNKKELIEDEADATARLVGVLKTQTEATTFESKKIISVTKSFSYNGILNGSQEPPTLQSDIEKFGYGTVSTTFKGQERNDSDGVASSSETFNASETWSAGQGNANVLSRHEDAIQEKSTALEQQGTVKHFTSTEAGLHLEETNVNEAKSEDKSYDLENMTSIKTSQQGLQTTASMGKSSSSWQQPVITEKQNVTISSTESSLYYNITEGNISDAFSISTTQSAKPTTNYEVSNEFINETTTDTLIPQAESTSQTLKNEETETKEENAEAKMQKINVLSIQSTVLTQPSESKEQLRESALTSDKQGKGLLPEFQSTEPTNFRQTTDENGKITELYDASSETKITQIPLSSYEFRKSDSTEKIMISSKDSTLTTKPVAVFNKGSIESESRLSPQSVEVIWKSDVGKESLNWKIPSIETSTGGGERYREMSEISGSDETARASQYMMTDSPFSTGSTESIKLEETATSNLQETDSSLHSNATIFVTGTTKIFPESGRQKLGAKIFDVKKSEETDQTETHRGTPVKQFSVLPSSYNQTLSTLQSMIEITPVTAEFASKEIINEESTRQPVQENFSNSETISQVPENTLNSSHSTVQKASEVTNTNVSAVELLEIKASSPEEMSRGFAVENETFSEFTTNLLQSSVQDSGFKTSTEKSVSSSQFASTLETETKSELTRPDSVGYGEEPNQISMSAIASRPGSKPTDFMEELQVLSRDRTEKETNPQVTEALKKVNKQTESTQEGLSTLTREEDVATELTAQWTNPMTVVSGKEIESTVEYNITDNFYESTKYPKSTSETASVFLNQNSTLATHINTETSTLSTFLEKIEESQESTINSTELPETTAWQTDMTVDIGNKISTNLTDLGQNSTDSESMIRSSSGSWKESNVQVESATATEAAITQTEFSTASQNFASNVSLLTTKLIQKPQQMQTVPNNKTEDKEIESDNATLSSVTAETDSLPESVTTFIQYRTPSVPIQVVPESFTVNFNDSSNDRNQETLETNNIIAQAGILPSSPQQISYSDGISSIHMRTSIENVNEMEKISESAPRVQQNLKLVKIGPAVLTSKISSTQVLTTKRPEEEAVNEESFRPESDVETTTNFDSSWNTKEDLLSFNVNSSASSESSGRRPPTKTSINDISTVVFAETTDSTAVVSKNSINSEVKIPMGPEDFGYGDNKETKVATFASYNMQSFVTTGPEFSISAIDNSNLITTSESPTTKTGHTVQPEATTSELKFSSKSLESDVKKSEKISSKTFPSFTPSTSFVDTERLWSTLGDGTTSDIISGEENIHAKIPMSPEDLGYGDSATILSRPSSFVRERNYINMQALQRERKVLSKLPLQKIDDSTRRKWRPFVINCELEVDDKGRLCEDWARGGLCNTHRPTMFLFCRRTCLCVGPPVDSFRRLRLQK